MRIPAMIMMAVGYALVYHAASLVRGYRQGMSIKDSPRDEGGVPLSVLLGIQRGRKRLPNPTPSPYQPKKPYARPAPIQPSGNTGTPSQGNGAIPV